MSKILKIQKDLGVLAHDAIGENRGKSYSFTSLGYLAEKLLPLLVKYKIELTQPVMSLPMGDKYVTCIASEAVDTETGETIAQSLIPFPQAIQPTEFSGTYSVYRKVALLGMFGIHTKENEEMVLPDPRLMSDDQLDMWINKSLDMTADELMAALEGYGFSVSPSQVIKIKDILG
jgi:hypothetical protein